MTFLKKLSQLDKEDFTASIGELFTLIIILTLLVGMLAGIYSLTLGLFFPLPVSAVVQNILYGVGAFSLFTLTLLFGD